METTAKLKQQLDQYYANIAKAAPLAKADMVDAWRFITQDELREAAKRYKEGQFATDRQKTVCIDFDGVIADYSQGYQGPDVFGDPLPGAAEVTQRLKDKGWKVIIFTTRRCTEALQEYLVKNGVRFDSINVNNDQPEGSNPGKPIADAYLDDRAIRFYDWAQAESDLLRLVKSGGTVRIVRDSRRKKAKITHTPILIKSKGKKRRQGYPVPVKRPPEKVQPPEQQPPDIEDAVRERVAEIQGGTARHLLGETHYVPSGQ